jgi:hypothetical protein
MLDIKLRNIKIDYKCLVDRREVFRELSTHELLLNSKRNSWFKFCPIESRESCFNRPLGGWIPVGSDC